MIEWQKRKKAFPHSIQRSIIRVFTFHRRRREEQQQQQQLKQRSISLFNNSSIQKHKLQQPVHHSEALQDNDETKEEGPNYFGYHIREIQDIFSSHHSISPPRTCVKKEVDDTSTSCCRSKEAIDVPGSSSLFSNGIGDGLSDFQRERLNTSLKQSVTNLSQEVDEMVDPVLALSQIKTLLRDKERLSSYPNSSDGNLSQPPCKKQKVSVSPSMSSPTHAGITGSKSCGEMNEDLLILLEDDGSQSKAAVKKHSDELSAKLEHMERELEELLDVVVSKCRPMSLAEKQQLKKLIQELPPKNLDRVVEIIQHNRKTKTNGHPCNEICIDLEKEDNVTLWRLYYYVEAFASAKKLSTK